MISKLTSPRRLPADSLTVRAQRNPRLAAIYSFVDYENPASSASSTSTCKLGRDCLQALASRTGPDCTPCRRYRLTWSSPKGARIRGYEVEGWGVEGRHIIYSFPLRVSCRYDVGMVQPCGSLARLSASVCFRLDDSAAGSRLLSCSRSITLVLASFRRSAIG